MWTLLAGGAGALVVAAGLVGFGYSAGSASTQRAWEADKAKRIQSAYEMSERARAADAKHFAQAKEAQDALTKRLDRARGDAAGSKSELDRLLNSPAAKPSSGPASDPDAAIRAARAAVPIELFAACARGLQALAGRADELEVLVIGWQEWYAGVSK